MSPEPSSLSDALRAGREAQGLTISQLAVLLEVDPGQVFRWESGERKPKADKLTALARRLELPIDELFALAGWPLPARSVDLPAMLRSQYDLPPEAIAEVQRDIERIAKKYRTKPTD